MSVEKNFWKQHWEGVGFSIAPFYHPVRRWIEHHAEDSKNGQTCIEIGCFPAKFLSVFGEKGYTLNGIDMFDDTDLLKPVLTRAGYNVDSMYKADFLTFNTSRTFDIVCSFGFIEHFKNWKYVLKRHIDLAKKDGKILIEVPNLNSPLYKFLYDVLEPNVLENHVMEVMDLNGISNAFENENCLIESKKYIGGFHFRFVTKHGLSHKIFALAINLTLGPLVLLFPKRIYSRYIGVTAKKIIKN
jgi:SAM-dependent methyltransferase